MNLPTADDGDAAVQWMGYDDTADFAAGFDTMSAPARAAARAVLMALISGE